VGLGVLGVVRVCGIRVNFEFFKDGAAETVVGDHAFHSVFDQAFRVLLSQAFRRIGFVATNVAGEAVVDFLLFFSTRQRYLGGIDDDDEISGIDVGGEDRLVFTTEEAGDLHCDTPEGAACRINHIPATLDFFGFCRKRFHYGKKSALPARISDIDDLLIPGKRGQRIVFGVCTVNRFLSANSHKFQLLL